MTDNKEEIISRILEVKFESDLSHKDFAEKSGIDPRRLSPILKGKRAFGDKVITNICRAFNINIAWLKTGQGEKYVPAVPASAASAAESITMPREVFDQITRLTETVLSQQRTIEELSKKTAGIVATA